MHKEIEDKSIYVRFVHQKFSFRRFLWRLFKITFTNIATFRLVFFFLFY